VRLDTFLTQAGERHPALVFRVSWANGLDIIRDLSAEGVPLLALDSNPRAPGLRSRLKNIVRRSGKPAEGESR
jgi:hypothetical protein